MNPDVTSDRGDAAKKTPASQRGQVHRQLQAAILTGGFPSGQMLPPERELMNRFGVTRDTIRRALRKLTVSGHLTCQPRIGYRVSPAFRGGKPVKTHAIGLIWSDVSGLVASQVLFSEFELATASIGCVLMFGSSGYDGERESEAIRRMAAGGMEGLFIAPARSGSRSAELERWIRDKRPVVLHGHPGRWLLPDSLSERCDRVDADNADGIRQVVEWLKGLGHRSAGFVCREPLEGSERFEAFRKCTGQLGLATEARWWVPEAGAGRDAGRMALARLKSSGDMPTAIVCSHDDTAMRLIEAIQEHGLRCPEDVSVAGFEGNPQRDGSGPPRLTTVDIHNDRHAQEAMRLLAKRFAGECGKPEHVRVPATLLVGGTTGVPPRGLGAGPAGQGA
jgi:DNA-binding LacI/PurR family transcriptional regulator